MFENIAVYPGDPILSLMEDFLADPRETKVNLSIGLYYDEAGNVPILQSVREAAAILSANPKPAIYLPMEGSSMLRQSVQRIVFGDVCDAMREERIATIQTVGGSGALHIAGRFIKAFLPGSDVWISDPTWDNHRTLLESAGLNVHTYPYLDAVTNGVDAAAMVATFESLPTASVILLQPSCHNPTGYDLSAEDFADVIAVAQRRGLIPLVDMAYQGFGDGPDADAAPIRKLVAAGLPVIVCNSFSKNFSLYGERVGGLSIVCSSAAIASRVQGQLKSIVREVYSSPPMTGAQLVAGVLGTPRLNALWRTEVAAMRDRMVAIRAHLRSVIEETTGQPVPYFTQQRGMFSYTGLTAGEVDYAREKHAIYLVRSGRLCVAGLNSRNVYPVAAMFADVFARSRA